MLVRVKNNIDFVWRNLTRYKKGAIFELEDPKKFSPKYMEEVEPAFDVEGNRIFVPVKEKAEPAPKKEEPVEAPKEEETVIVNSEEAEVPSEDSPKESEEPV
jgi:hypothetical protein